MQASSMFLLTNAGGILRPTRLPWMANCLSRGTLKLKGRVKGAGTVCVTRNEILYAFNQGDKFVLAVVLVGENDAVEGPHYIRNPFDHEPGWGVSSINFDLKALLDRAEKS